MVKFNFFIVTIYLFMVTGCSKDSSRNAESVLANRDAVISDLFDLGIRAQQYYRQLNDKGGRRNSFIGFEIPDTLKETQYGKYSLEKINSQSLSIIGTGKVIGNDELNPIEVVIKVLPDRIEPLEELN